MEKKDVLHSEDLHQVSPTSTFHLFSECKVRVPEYYEHEHQLNTLNTKKFYKFDKIITDKHFSKVSNKLEGGKEYLVRLFQSSKNFNSKECLRFLNSQKSLILVGAQGLSLCWELNKRMFPIGKGVVSFDIKSSLYKDKNGSYRLPNMIRMDKKLI